MWSFLNTALKTTGSALERLVDEECPASLPDVSADCLDAPPLPREHAPADKAPLRKPLLHGPRDWTGLAAMSKGVALTACNHFLRRYECSGGVLHQDHGTVNPEAITRADYLARLLDAHRSHSPADKAEFLAMCSERLFPYLSDIATWQTLSAEIGYAVYPEGAQVRLNGIIYSFADRITDRRASFLAYRLQSLDSKHHVILLPGTTAAVTCPIVHSTVGPGLVADAEHAGIGTSSFSVYRQTLKNWVSAVPEDGHLVLTGHSLGGARATRLWLDMTAEQRKLGRLRTFSAPGLDAATIDSAKDTSGDVLLVQHAMDFVPRAGERHIMGRRFCITSPFSTINEVLSMHGNPYFLHNELWGRENRYVEFSGELPTFRDFERIRKALFSVASKYETSLLERWPEQNEISERQT